MNTAPNPESREVPRESLISDLLHRPGPVINSPVAVQPHVARRLAMLERQAPEVVGRAAVADVPIRYLGTAPLFAAPRLYQGVGTDWVLGPANRTDDAVVPRRERRALEKLAQIGDFDRALIYIAHEVEQSKTAELVPVRDAAGAVVLDHSQAHDLVGPVPDPPGAVGLGQELGRRSSQVISAVSHGVPVVAGVAAAAVAAVVLAPFVLTAAAFASLAVLDPIVLAALPAGKEREGDPAVWFALAAWNW